MLEFSKPNNIDGLEEDGPQTLELGLINLKRPISVQILTEIGPFGIQINSSLSLDRSDWSFSSNHPHDKIEIFFYGRIKNHIGFL